MRALEYLDLSSNKITELPAALFFLRNLKTLKFADNMVKAFNTQSLRSLEKLVLLDISNNKFESLNEELDSFSVVEIFRAQNNCLEFIDDSLGSMNKLQTLQLSSNALKMLPHSLQLCTLITELNISDNKFETIPDSISCLENLTNFDASRCEISSGLFEDFFSKLTVLVRLDLSRNKIIRMPASFYFLKHLTWCDLSSNLIAELSSEINELESIIHLDLNRNRISLLPTSIQHLGNLEYLDISWNLIPFLPDEFGNLPKLHRFNAEHNKMAEYQHCLRNVKTLSSWNLNGNFLPSYIPTKFDVTVDEGEGVVEPISPSMLQRRVSAAFHSIAKCKYIMLEPVSDLSLEELEEPKQRKKAQSGPPLSAAEKREIRRQREQKLADEKACFEKKLYLTKSTFHWVSQYAAECRSTYQQLVVNITNLKTAYKSGISSPHVCRTLSTSSKLILEEYSKLANDSNLDFQPEFEQMMNLNIECEIQEAIVMYENVARMLVAYCINVGWIKDSVVVHSEQKASPKDSFSSTKTSNTTGGARNSQLLSDAMGIEDDPLNKILQPVMSNEIDRLRFPEVLFHPQLGPSKDEISSVAFQCYMELGSLVFRRIETISKTIRGIEKHYNFKESCLDITQRYGNDFEDVIFDEYEVFKSRVESVADGGQTTKVSRKSALLSKMSSQLSVVPGTKEPSGTPEMEIKIDNTSFSYGQLSDPSATVKYLHSSIKNMSLYALTLFCSATNIMALWVSFSMFYIFLFHYYFFIS
jgi:Leucine-rich repeat (LRR) protein